LSDQGLGRAECQDPHPPRCWIRGPRRAPRGKPHRRASARRDPLHSCASTARDLPRVQRACHTGTFL